MTVEVKVTVEPVTRDLMIKLAGSPRKIGVYLDKVIADHALVEGFSAGVLANAPYWFNCCIDDERRSALLMALSDYYYHNQEYEAWKVRLGDLRVGPDVKLRRSVLLYQTVVERMCTMNAFALIQELLDYDVDKITDIMTAFAKARKGE